MWPEYTQHKQNKVFAIHDNDDDDDTTHTHGTGKAVRLRPVFVISHLQSSMFDIKTFETRYDIVTIMSCPTRFSLKIGKWKERDQNSRNKLIIIIIIINSQS